MLIAQAQAENLAIISNDRIFDTTFSASGRRNR